jgi:exodeoxyribonuclease V alpha subunit
MNGSIVFLRSDDPREEAVVVDTDEGGSLLIPYNEAGDLRLAYAISVHKAQGCEVPVVVTICHRSHLRMLSRPLLYTAITRARSSCVLVGDLGVLETAISRDKGWARYSGLAERLQD